MREIPILFNTEMVRAILEGRKTVTRRVVKFPGRLDPDGPVTRVSNGKFAWRLGPDAGVWIEMEPPYRPGDILYVRETWCNGNKPGVAPEYYYLADMADEEDYDSREWTWRPSIHMPKGAARIILRVTDVRVERLGDMSSDDAIAEGMEPEVDGTKIGVVNAFCHTWNNTIKPANLDRYGWDTNPWVWVIEFERCERPERGRE